MFDFFFKKNLLCFNFYPFEFFFVAGGGKGCIFRKQFLRLYFKELNLKVALFDEDSLLLKCSIFWKTKCILLLDLGGISDRFEKRFMSQRKNLLTEVTVFLRLLFKPKT